MIHREPSGARASNRAEYPRISFDKIPKIDKHPNNGRKGRDQNKRYRVKTYYALTYQNQIKYTLPKAKDKSQQEMPDILWSRHSPSNTKVQNSSTSDTDDNPRLLLKGKRRRD